MAKTEITRADILPIDEYGRRRAELRRRQVEQRRDRRLPVGPYAMLYFENFDTMLAQVHEMLFIERGGDEQLVHELEVYNPLVPKGRELVATLMFEIEDEGRRRTVLGALGGVERTVALLIGDDRIAAVPEDDVERTTAEGKTSSVHFLHFPFTDRQVAAFRDGGTKVAVAIEHANYGHAAIVPEAARRVLAGDFG